MTATVSIPDQVTAAAPLGASQHASAAVRDWVTFAVTVAILLVTYLGLQNPYWVPGGDSEVYTTIARNLAIGKGYTFNGYPVSMVPPGWPAMLALVMKISPTFMLLKLVTMSCMLGSLAIMYWICRRFASPIVCAIVILCTGILSHVYALTFWLHSDALFCLVSSAALLVAFQISERRDYRWRIPLLIVLCSLSVIARWAGVFTWLTVGAVLLHGELWPTRNRYWIAAILTAVVTAGTFLGLRRALKVPPEVQRVVNALTSEEQGGVPAEKIDKTVATSYDLFNPAGGGISAITGRILRWGNWYGYLLWQPLRLGQSNNLVGVVSGLIGWSVLGLLILVAWRAAWNKQWLWPALLAYALALDINWPHPNARYLVPIAPLIVLGVFKAFEIIREEKGTRLFSARGIETGSKVILGYFAASILVCNGALYACDVWAAHASDFYARYEAGMNQDMISAAHWLNEHPTPDGTVAVSERYVNLGRTRKSQLGLRATTLLTGKSIVTIPSKYLRAGDPRRNQNFINWARSLGIKYALYQTEVSPWRLFHFRVPWLQEMMSGEPAIDVGAGWRLYEIPPAGDECIRVSVPIVANWPTRVPGM